MPRPCCGAPRIGMPSVFLWAIYFGVFRLALACCIEAVWRLVEFALRLLPRSLSWIWDCIGCRHYLSIGQGPV